MGFTDQLKTGEGGHIVESYGNLLVITGNFYGIIYTFNDHKWRFKGVNLHISVCPFLF